MLGPIGKLAKWALSRGGYELARPTQFERSLPRSYWEDWFSHDSRLFADIYARNRQTLSKVPRWAANEDLEGSLWRYGVPPVWNVGTRELGQTSLDEIESEITYSDLIGFIASQIHPLKYLEIGVSVGKNFAQIVELFPDAEIFGLDVEDPHPALVRLFERVEIVWQADDEQEVETLSGKSAKIRLTHYRLHRTNGKPVHYVKGDQFSPSTWASIGTQFNFIFSDGVHNGSAVKDELRHLRRCDLLDLTGRFAMYWDDLVNFEMQSAFDGNARELRPGRHAMHWIHGTYGSRRLNGIFANFSL